MDILKEFLDPIPLPIMALAIFGLILFWLISRCFRLPANFQMKEEVREQIRFKLFDKEMNSEDEAGSEGENKGDGAEGEKTADAANEPSAAGVPASPPSA